MCRTKPFPILCTSSPNFFIGKANGVRAPLLHHHHHHRHQYPPSLTMVCSSSRSLKPKQGPRNHEVHAEQSTYIHSNLDPINCRLYYYGISCSIRKCHSIPRTSLFQGLSGEVCLLRPRPTRSPGAWYGPLILAVDCVLVLLYSASRTIVPS